MPQFDTAAIPPLQLKQQQLTVSATLARQPRLAPLQLDDHIRAYVDRYIDRDAHRTVRVRQLTRLLMDRSLIGLEYEPEVNGTARDVFYSGRANCLGFSHLYIAMARHVGLDAHYQQLDLKPRWRRQGRWLMVEQHVNVVGQLRRGQVYTTDIDAKMRYRTLSKHKLSDAEGLALHYNNLAMAALIDNQPDIAWSWLLRALELAPGRADLWANLGTLYKSNGQLAAAKWSFEQALDHNPQLAVAMKHMRRLLLQQGEQVLAAQYTRRLRRHQSEDPYYQAWLAQWAAQQGDWEQASQGIARAIGMLPDEFEFHVTAARYHRERGEVEQSHESLVRAEALAQGAQRAWLENQQW